MTGLEDTSYNREGGWEKLSGKLLIKAFSELNTATPEQGAEPAKSNRPSLLYPAWKMAAAAILLLTLGFLTGRLSYFSARKDRQNITQITAKALAAPTSVVPDSISPMVKATADAAGSNAIVSSRAGGSAKSAAAVNNTRPLTITKKRASGPAAAAPAIKATAMRKEKGAVLPTDQTAPQTTAPSTGSPATAAQTPAPPRPPTAAPFSVCEHAPSAVASTRMVMIFFIVVPLTGGSPSSPPSP